MTDGRVVYRSCDPHRMLVLSLRPRFAEAILSGEKTVELRRVEPQIELPTRALVYASSPTRSLMGQCVVRKAVRLPLSMLWRRYGHATAVTQEEFHDYFAQKETGIALLLSNPVRLSSEVPLVKLRQSVDRFRAPQSFAYVAVETGARLLALAS